MTRHLRSKTLVIGVAFAVGLGVGAAIWSASARITGGDEPWDAPGAEYPLALLGAGLLGGLLFPRRWPAMVLGSFLGQAVVLVGRALAGPAGDSLWPLGLMFLGIYSVLTLVAAGVGSSARRHLRWRHGAARPARRRS